MQHAILGPGGVGGLIAAVLAHAGDRVTLIVRQGTERRYPHEIHLESKFGNINAPVAVAVQIAQPFDVLWITVKATQLEDALKAAQPDVQVRAVVPLLNGIDHVERLRQRFGTPKVVPATIAVESERVAPGRIVHRSPFARLSMAASGKDILGTTVDAFRRFGFGCEFVKDERTLLWRKLVFLAPIALSTTAGRCAVGDVINNPARWAQLNACILEACLVASADGAKVNGNTVLAGIKTLPYGMRSSMQKDVASDNPPELDAISGPILRGGTKYGIPVPATLELVEAIRKSVSA